uniref:Phorbol-ester/DAG-type domain-containing protein n=1 Tax=Steinernema glaseri TaxID=37863 RepID=A0A1I8A1Q5_9BILA
MQHTFYTTKLSEIACSYCEFTLITRKSHWSCDYGIAVYSSNQQRIFRQPCFNEDMQYMEFANVITMLFLGTLLHYSNKPLRYSLHNDVIPDCSQAMPTVQRTVTAAIPRRLRSWQGHHDEEIRRE